MSLFSRLTERILNELNYGDFMSKSKGVTQLFPKFHQRVRGVDNHGGIKLVSQRPKLWTFKVASGDDERHRQGVSYDVFLNFKNIPELISKTINNKDVWNKDKESVDYRRLAEEVLNTVDMESDCSCPSDLFHGFSYLKTQYRYKPGGTAQYGDQENRPPNIKNPGRHGLTCKHGYDVLQRLPFYTSTFASYLKKYYSKEVEQAIQVSLNKPIEPEITSEVPQANKRKTTRGATIPKTPTTNVGEEEPKEELPVTSPGQVETEETTPPPIEEEPKKEVEKSEETDLEIKPRPNAASTPATTPSGEIKIKPKDKEKPSRLNPEGL